METFVVEEDTSWKRDTLKVLVRFLRGLYIIKISLPIYLITLFAAVALPQILLWAFGRYLECGPQPCFVGPLAGVGLLEVTLSFLTVLLVLGIFARIFCWTIYEVGGQWSCQAIHADMVKALSRVKTSYFDAHPSGRFINRLVGDFDAVRTTAIIRIGDTIFAFLRILANAVLTALVSMAAFFLVLPAVLASLYLQQFLAPMLQRCNSIRAARRGEVLHRETDVIEGSRLYSLYSENEALSRKLHSAVHNYVQIHLLRGRIEAWGRFWLDTIAGTYEFFALAVVVYAVRSGSTSAILAAVIFTAILRLRDSFAWFNWNTTYLIESLARVKRLFEIVDLPEQTKEEIKDRVLDYQGSCKDKDTAIILGGDINFQNLSMSYRPTLPLIFENLNLSIPYGKHTGIFGRTGSGKSSIVQCLFRMVYVQSGDIVLGRTSLYDLGVDQVRELFGMVPQDPYLFAGTLRSNLDRFNEYSDAELLETLNTVGLGTPLNFLLEEGGRNLSQGERQLVCLARVLVAKKQYVIMDEPTSSLDSITDAKIQRILSEVLKEKTVITIAHRLETLNRHDWLIELGFGKVIRDGRPEEILASEFVRHRAAPALSPAEGE